MDAQRNRLHLEWRTGWRSLIAGFFGMATSWNFVNIMSGLFLKPMQAEFGWSRTELSFGPLAGLIVAVLLPFVSVVIDRIGARRVALCGLLGLSSAFAALASLPASRPVFYCAIAYLSLTASLMTSVTVARGVAPWFRDRLGTAIGLMMTGISVSGAVFVPVIAAIILEHGWREAFLAMAGIELLVGLPFVLFWFHEPSPGQHRTFGTPAAPDGWTRILRRPAFWQLAIASGLAALPIGGFLAHLLPLLTDRGLSMAAAGGLVSIFAIAVGGGRIATGLLFDRLSPPLVAAGMLLSASAGALLCWYAAGGVSSWKLLAVMVVLIGGAQGAEGDYIKYFSMRVFGVQNFARVVSIMAMIISAGMAVGGLLFAIAFDRTGSYGIAVVGSVFLYAAAAGVFASIRMAPSRSGSRI